MKPWGVYVTRPNPPVVVHVIPEDDIIKHEQHEWCPCLSIEVTELDHGVMYIHSALDKRKN